MIVILPAGSSQDWGSEVLINITEAIAPPDSENYQVLIKASKMNGATVLEVVCLEWVWTDTDGAVSFDLSPYLKSSGDYRLEFGQGFFPVIGAEL